ncbi:hypothetical protein U27_03538 [Candidatus Vecturithrix granuli]|uniref:Bacterial repeat domain-containing protein n=1 Tax=Vecturithrix granuli TaxID=1499967 RepID=A0A081BW71_VECG1|nr:hypothetical protein U27_03538 [Candidatus Vecturithrix granuli]
MKKKISIVGVINLLMMVILLTIVGSNDVAYAATEGKAEIWGLDGSGGYSVFKSYSVGSGYYATEFAHNGTNSYLLWARPADEGTATLWTLNASGGFVSGKTYTAGKGYYATGFSHNGSNGYMIWARPAAEGSAVVWTLTSAGNFISGKSYTAGPGYYATDFVHNGTNAYLLWARSADEGTAVVWKLSAAGAFLSGKSYSAGKGYYATAFSHNGSKAGIVWARPPAEGRGVVWTLNADLTYSSGKSYTKLAGWYATGHETLPASGSSGATLKTVSQETIVVKKAGSGSGTITAGSQVCNAACTELAITYIAGKQVDVNVTPAAGSYFAGWETAGGVQIENIYYANPGDTVFAIFEQK